MLQHIAGHSGSKRLRDKILLAMHGEDEQLDLRHGLLDLAAGIEPVEQGKGDVHQGNVRLLLLDGSNEGPAVRDPAA